MKRIQIVASHPILGQGIEALLACEEGIQIVGVQTDPDRALEQIGALQPDVVIVDAIDSDANWAQVTLRVLKEGLQREGLHPCLIALSMSDNSILICYGERRLLTDVSDLVKVIRG